MQDKLTWEVIFPFVQNKVINMSFCLVGFELAGIGTVVGQNHSSWFTRYRHDCAATFPLIVSDFKSRSDPTKTYTSSLSDFIVTGFLHNLCHACFRSGSGQPFFILMVTVGIVENISLLCLETVILSARWRGCLR